MQHFNNSLDNVDHIDVTVVYPFDEPVTSQTQARVYGVFTELSQM